MPGPPAVRRVRAATPLQWLLADWRSSGLNALPPLTSWPLAPQVGHGREISALALLQRPHIRHDRPAIVRIDARGIRVHHAITTGDDVEDVLCRRCPQSRAVIRGR